VSRACRTAVAMLAVAMTLTGCIKSTTFNPYAAPDTNELDRLQQIVNEAPDLEPTRVLLSELDTQIRAAIAKYSPETKLAPYGRKESLLACRDPYTWTVGQEYRSTPLAGEPAAGVQQWQRIVDELTPVIENAGYQPSSEPTANSQQLYYGKDGAFVRLTNGSGGSPLMYEYGTGCRLPAAWRTSPPPPDTVGGDPNIHYPYLFGDEGGRTVKPG
jgi:Lipoprotein confined to pathogenic Mycobacterium